MVFCSNASDCKLLAYASSLQCYLKPIDNSNAPHLAVDRVKSVKAQSLQDLVG